MTDDEIKGLFSHYGQYVTGKDYALIRAIESAVAQPAQKPWVGLTDEEVVAVWHESNTLDELVRITEAKLKEKNT